MIKNIARGIVIGIANIIPGVSGGTLAVSMGIYDKLIHCITHIIKEFKESVLFLLPIAIGAGLALIGLSFVLESMLTNYPIPTNALFIGLIVGGLPAVIKQVKGEKIRVSYVAVGVLFFAIVAGMAALGGVEGHEVSLHINMGTVLILLLVGIVAAATMIIPGVSGSMMLLILGYYYPILSTIKSFFSALVVWDFPTLLHCFCILFPFGIGVLIGIIGIAKIIEWIFKRYPYYAYWAIIGLIAASPVAILLCASWGSVTVLTMPISVLAFVLGFLVAMKLG